MWGQDRQHLKYLGVSQKAAFPRLAVTSLDPGLVYPVPLIPK